MHLTAILVASAPANAAAPVSSLDAIVELLLDYQSEIVTAVLGLIAGLLLHQVFPTVGRWVGAGLAWSLRKVRIEGQLQRHYLRRLASDLRQLKLLGMSKPRDLEQVFVPLRIHEWSSLLDEGKRPAAGHYLTLEHALAVHPRVVLLGDPGAGKTSLTKHAVVLVAEGKLKIAGRSYLPVYVALNEVKSLFGGDELADRLEPPTAESVMSRVLQSYGFTDAETFLVKKLSAGRCFIVFDGFDELATYWRQDGAAAMIKNLVRSYPDDNRVVVTSREAGFRQALFHSFDSLEITDVPLPQANSFIERWFADDVEKASRLKEVLSDSPQLRLLSTSPLMLAVICITFDARAELPNRRADLYEYCIDTLIVRWDESRGVDRRPAFSAEAKLTVLKNVACELHDKRKSDFTRRDLLAAIRRHLPAAKVARFHNVEFLDEVVEHTGLVRKKGPDTYTFQHLTFQEYLAALKVVDDGSDGVRYLVERAGDPWWSESIVLAAGIQRDATDLVNLIHQRARPHPSDDTYLLLARCLADADLTNTDAKDEILTRVVQLAYFSEPNA